MPHDLAMSSDLERVAVKLARFALPVVTMRPQPGLLNPAIRAAVLIDLALTGTLTQAGDLLEVDTTPLPGSRPPTTS